MGLYLNVRSQSLCQLWGSLAHCSSPLLMHSAILLAPMTCSTDQIGKEMLWPSVLPCPPRSMLANRGLCLCLQRKKSEHSWAVVVLRATHHQFPPAKELTAPWGCFPWVRWSQPQRLWPRPWRLGCALWAPVCHQGTSVHLEGKSPQLQRPAPNWERFLLYFTCRSFAIQKWI